MPEMDMKPTPLLFKAGALLGVLAAALSAQAQVNTNPVPNSTISWDFDCWGFSNAGGGSGVAVPDTAAGLARATNWNDGWSENWSATSPWGNPTFVANLFDISGAGSGVDLRYNGFNGASVVAAHKGMDADGSYNREMLNGYMNTGPAGWNPPITNSFVSVSNIPYALYDVVVYFNSDNAGRHGSIDNGATTYYFTTVGGPSVSGANAYFLPTFETNSSVFPSADFAFFPGMTGSTATFTEHPKSGNDQWLGICGFQLIQASNTYVLYGAYPASQIVPVGQSAAFKVIAGGQTPQYQWRRNGNPISGATNATYSIPATATGQDGSYDVVVTNGFSSTTSSVATLTFYTPKSLVWAGVNSTWDTATASWTVNNGSSTTTYTETDKVLFSPLGAASSSVSLSGTLSPSLIEVSNAAYTFSSGTLAGSGTLHLRNNAMFILDTIDTRSGATIIDSGSTFQLDNGDTAGGMGAGALTNNGGLVFNAAGDEGYAYPVYGTGSITNLGPSGLITLGSTVNASYLVQAGGGTLLLQGSNNITGGFIVSSGTVWARAGNSLGTAPVQLSGGELQLIYGFDFPGSTMTLSGGLLHGGISGSAIYRGAVTLATDSTIQTDSGNSFTLANPVGLNGGANNLTKNGNGTLVLAGATNTWASVTINAGTLQIGNGSTNGSLGEGVITDVGGLAFNLSSDLTVPHQIIGIGTISQTGSCAVLFTGDLSSLSGLTTVSAGKLGGTATFGGPVAVLPGGTLVAGTASAIGTLTLNSDLALGGNVSVKVNKALAQTSDLFSVGGSLINTNNGVITVSNLGAALQVGDSFKLFSQAVSGGESLAVVGAGVIWTNHLATDGTIAVLATTIPHPGISAVSVSNGTNLVLSGTNGYAGAFYYVLSSTNVAAPLASWTRETSGSFGSTGSFAVTNAVSAGVPQKFYRLMVP
jgi:autotransporter-associated beta strand protein